MGGRDQIHAVLSEPTSSIFDRNAAKDLRHRAVVLNTPVTSISQSEGLENLIRQRAKQQSRDAESTEGQTAPNVLKSSVTTEVATQLITEVSGIRTELQEFRNSFDLFRGDFNRMIGAIEGLTASMNGRSPSSARSTGRATGVQAA